MGESAIPSPIDLLKPSFQLRVCICCGMRAAWRFDKRKRPFHYCPHCGIRIFIYSIRALVGLQILHEIVLRTGPQRIQTESERRIHRKMAALIAR